jgi:REP element-mobilizing transposase RayT
LCEYKGVGLLEGKACIDHPFVSVDPAQVCSSDHRGVYKEERDDRLNGTVAQTELQRSGFWARGYYVSTVGLMAKIRKYIKDQEINEAIVDKHDRDAHDPF